MKFSGPIFIVGMQRSGTKLLRDLMNQNPKIGIPTAETHIIPYMIKQFGNPPHFNNKKEFNSFYQELRKTTFWNWMKSEGLIISKDYIYKKADINSWSSIFEVILRFYASPGKSEDFIWGDKSPTYLCQIKLLKEIFPEARFLHIIRDPRDCCLSAKKIWKKNLYRTADLWRRRIEIGRKDGSELSKDYMEVIYETLLDHPEKVMRSISDFLNCSFTPLMTTLTKPSENLGDTKGQVKIVTENKRKFINELSSSEIKRIEEIVYPVMRTLPFKFEYDVEFKPLGFLTSKILILYDGIKMAKHYIHEMGLINGIIYSLLDLKDKSPIL